MSSQEFADLSNDQLAVIDAACDEFEAAINAGTPIALEQYMQCADVSLQKQLLRELLATELEYLRGGGQQVKIAGYKSRFPDFSSVVDQVFGTSNSDPTPSTDADETESLHRSYIEVSLAATRGDAKKLAEIFNQTKYTVTRQLAREAINQLDVDRK